MVASPEPSSSLLFNPSVPQRIVSWLFRDSELSLSFFEWLKLLSATILLRNKLFLDEFYTVLAQKIESTLSTSSILSAEKKEIILYNALSYLVLSNPKEGSTLTINGFRYTIKKIPITSGWLSGPYVAYALTVVENSLAKSILVFKGTTFPTDGGFLAGVMADTRPHGAVGAQLYARGQDRLQAWITQEYQRTGQKVLCTGQSLGGAMSLHCHIHQPNEVDFFAINPPSFTSRERCIYEQQGVVTPSNELKVICHLNDPVFSLGSQFLPVGTRIFNHGDPDEGWLNAHAKTALCKEDTPEPEFNLYANVTQRNILWKISKPFLFVMVLVCHAIALPVRLMIETSHQFFGRLKTNTLTVDAPPPVIDNQVDRAFPHKKQISPSPLFKPVSKENQPTPAVDMTRELDLTRLGL
jgi:hypothetical protein